MPRWRKRLTLCRTRPSNRPSCGLGARSSRAELPPALRKFYCSGQFEEVGMIAIGRRNLLLGVAAATMLAACGGASGGAGVSADDMSIGQANAPATLIEYASSTCPHCAHFHETVFDQLKANYIDTGKLR